MQCEVLQHKPQGDVPPPEDPIPEHIDLVHGLPFAFHGLGQPVHGTNMEEDQVHEQQHGDWEQWPVQIEAQDQPVQNVDQQPHLNLNDLLDEDIGVGGP